MSPPSQQTLKAQVQFEGIGVHSGAGSTLRILPSPPDSGLVFKRVDTEGQPVVPARLEYVTGTELGTSLGAEGATVRTVEHVLAALAVLEVDNAVLELDGPEPPILDGSFSPFLSAIREAGLETQAAPATVISVAECITVSGDRESSYVALRDDGLKISATIDFPHPAIGRQSGTFRIDEGRFEVEVAPARTFGFRADAEGLRARGLAQGSSLDNTVVLDGAGVMNDGLRFCDEFLRHKVGDLVGDLALLGGRVRGHVVAERPSHHGNVELAMAIRDQHEKQTGAETIDIHRIMSYLPHRYPMLLVDRILEFESGKRIVGLKNVTINEPFFDGHFPDHPIMPGVLIIEAMGQVGGLLLMDAVENPEDKVVYFMSLDNVKWRRPVTPGDQIIFELEMLHFRRDVCKMKGTGKVDGHVVAEANLVARIMDR